MVQHDANETLKKTMVSKQACFRQLNEKEIGELAHLWKEIEVPAGEVIVIEGDIVDSVYLIVKGTAEVRHDKVVDGQIQSEVIAELTEGQSIGLNEEGFYSLSGRRTATVAAKTAMTLLKLNVAAFHGFALYYPHVNTVMRQQAQQFLTKDGTFPNT